MQDRGNVLTALTHLQPIDLTPIYGNIHFGFHAFREVYEELLATAPVAAHHRHVQEALLVLFLCEPQAFRKTGKTRKSKRTLLPEIDLGMQRASFKALQKRIYTRKRKESEERILVFPSIANAFAAIYHVEECPTQEIGKRLFKRLSTKEDVDKEAERFMIALTRMHSLLECHATQHGKPV